MAEMGNLETYRTRFDNIREGLASQVTGGMSLIDELLKELSYTETTLRQTKFDLDNEREARRRLQEAAEEHERWKERLGSRPFVVALIDADADSYVFQDSYIKMGEDGGRNAADAFLASLQKFVRDKEGVSDGVDLIVRAFANVGGLGKALERDNRVNDSDQLRKFATGFSNRLPLFDFVDVGPGSELADNKVRESAKFFVESFQCKHLILACGYDNGYVPCLTQFAADKLVAGRITLLEGRIPFPIKIQKLGLNTTRFGSIFSEQNQPTAWQSLASPARAWGFSPKISGPSANANNNSGGPVAVGPRQVMRPRVPLVGRHRFEVQSERLGPVLKDKSGRRVDKPLSVDMAAVERIKRGNLCFYLYLRGECGKPCGRNHEYRQLSEEEYDALWVLARKGRCRASENACQDGRNDCSDAMCVYGHGVSGEQERQESR